MTSPRIPITAGPHDVGFTHRPSRCEQNAWRVCATAWSANPSGLPRLRTGIEGPYNVTGISKHRRGSLFTCRPATAAKESPCASDSLSCRRAYRRPAERTIWKRR
jgi:hypothetical protein